MLQLFARTFVADFRVFVVDFSIFLVLNFALLLKLTFICYMVQLDL